MSARDLTRRGFLAGSLTVTATVLAPLGGAPATPPPKVIRKALEAYLCGDVAKLGGV